MGERATIDQDYLHGAADAIRRKDGTSNTYTPAQFEEAIDAIPTGGITPTGTINITENGSVDVTQYATANVNVSGGGDDSFSLKNYIESSGAQYINTGYSVTTGTYIEAVAFVPDNGASYPALFGARSSTVNEVVAYMEFNARNIGLVWANGDSGLDMAFWPSGHIGKKCVYALGQNGVNGVWDADGNGFKGKRNTGTASNLPLYIFVLNDNNIPNSVTFCAAKLYRFRIYEGETLVHEFLPWLDGNNVACLKDTVTGDLKYNAGTGAFTYGTDA